MAHLRQSNNIEDKLSNGRNKIVPSLRSVTPGIANNIADIRQIMLEKDLDDRFFLGRIKEDEKEHSAPRTFSELLKKKNSQRVKIREEDEIIMNKIPESIGSQNIISMKSKDEDIDEEKGNNVDEENKENKEEKEEMNKDKKENEEEEIEEKKGKF